jgi:hypothetical protein
LHEQGLARSRLALDDEGGGAAVDHRVEGGGERVLDLGAADDITDVVGGTGKGQGHGSSSGVVRGRRIRGAAGSADMPGCAQRSIRDDGRARPA